jgi:hypothetical protein
MIIELIHYQQFANVDHSWIYLGGDYLKLMRCEQDSVQKRVSLQSQLDRQQKIQLQPFLRWLEQQRLANNDSLHWWMSNLAGRNNMVSPFYLGLCQIAALVSWLETHGDCYQKIVVVCEDSYVLSDVYRNLKDSHTVQYGFKQRLYLMKDSGLLLARAAYTFLRQCSRFIKHAWHAKQSRPDSIESPKGEVYLVHQCLDDKSFKSADSVRCSYFRELPDWLRQQGKQVHTLAWFCNVQMPLKTAYQRLRQSNALIADDWLTPKDYLWSLYQAFKSAFCLKKNIEYPVISCHSLVTRERLLQLCGAGATYWRYIPMLKRWSPSITTLVTLDHYENMLYEHPIRKTIRDLPLKSYSIGFYHVLVSKGFLGFNSVASEWESSVKPDRVVCNGIIARDNLINLGMPEDRVITGAGIRQTIPTVIKPINRAGDLVILLSLNSTFSAEVLESVKAFHHWITSELKLGVRVKPHPMMSHKALLSRIGWTKLPPGWTWDFGDIDAALSTARCVITLMTASAFDAILAGICVLPVKSELQQMDNSLDVLEDRFPVLKAVPVNELCDKLNDIIIRKCDYYENEFTDIQKHLIEGINGKSDAAMQSFIVE